MEDSRMTFTRLAQLNNAVDNYFTMAELQYLHAMICSYQNLIDKDPAYEIADYVSELFLLLIELNNTGVTDQVKSRAAYYLKALKTKMLMQARRTKTRKKVEDVILQLHSFGDQKNEHLENINSFVKYLLDNGEDELFYVLLLTVSFVLNDKEATKDKLNISKISSTLPIHYLKYRRHVAEIRGLYGQT